MNLLSKTIKLMAVIFIASLAGIICIAIYKEQGICEIALSILSGISTSALISITLNVVEYKKEKSEIFWLIENTAESIYRIFTFLEKTFNQYTKKITFNAFFSATSKNDYEKVLSTIQNCIQESVKILETNEFKISSYSSIHSNKNKINKEDYFVFQIRNLFQTIKNNKPTGINMELLSLKLNLVIAENGNITNFVYTCTHEILKSMETIKSQKESLDNIMTEFLKLNFFRNISWEKQRELIEKSTSPVKLS